MRKKTKKEKPKVLLLFDTDRDYRRGLLRGISNYYNIHQSWNVHLGRPSEIVRVIEFIKNWAPDGLIYETPLFSEMEKLIAMDIPVIIQAFPDQKGKKLGHILPDNFRMGIIAAEYYMEKGFTAFAYFGYKGTTAGHKDLAWTRERGEGFRQTLSEKGFSVSVYEQDYTEELRLGEEELLGMADWLKGLARPVAVFACNDRRAGQVIEACRIAGLSIPDEVAVLGVDNEDVTCSFFNPPLSSIALNAERAGYEAAEQLDKLITGQKTEPETIMLLPMRVVERQSTNVMQIQDKDVASAIKYIDKNSGKILQIADVLKSVSVSRRSLELKFARILGHSIYDQIRRCHVRHIARMLTETDVPILLLASYLGYTSENNMTRFFHKETGYTPSEYRKRFGQK